MRKVKISPPFPQEKQCQICRSGDTMKEGVLSAWKGQFTLKFRPNFLRGKYSWISATISILFRTWET
jgi:hypothetical protein